MSKFYNLAFLFLTFSISKNTRPMSILKAKFIYLT